LLFKLHKTKAVISEVNVWPSKSLNRRSRRYSKRQNQRSSSSQQTGKKKNINTHTSKHEHTLHYCVLL